MAEEVSPALRSYQSRVSNNVLAVFGQNSNTVNSLVTM